MSESTLVESTHPHEPVYVDPTFWVAVAFITLWVLIGKKIWKAFAGMLDGHAAKIQSDLAEAHALRQEAEQLLATYRRRHAESMKESEALLENARAEAAALAARAEQEMKATLTSRSKLAQEKIAQAEAQAIADIRAHVAEITVASARRIVTEQLARQPGDAQVLTALAAIDRKLH